MAKRMKTQDVFNETTFLFLPAGPPTRGPRQPEIGVPAPCYS